MTRVTKRVAAFGVAAGMMLLAGGAMAAPGGLLDTPYDPATRLGITPDPVIQPAPAPVLKATIENGGVESANWPEEADFHVINGEYASTNFVGRHYTSVLYSQYREGNGNRWCHYEYGASQSKFWRCSGNSAPGS
ncbi:MAG: hypothetical protein R3E12_13765 [Candidatus Eisenbacteria bacterium]|uniref:Uncharacterized protein n=1 Tax=Eiseniibacteriota bacterium TaxID=2212470 RepID=A0A956RNY6_UNCEI|nr:hypothetical protein [Candidatus Eisenbacteria bacterium]